MPVNEKAGPVREEPAGDELRASDELKRAEESLLQSERRYRLLAENAADIIWTVDINSPQRLTYISPSVGRLLGYSVEEAMLLPMNEVFTPNSLGLAGRALSETVGELKPELEYHQESRTLELELIHRNGSLVPAEVKFSYLPGPDGRPAEILAVALDIT